MTVQPVCFLAISASAGDLSNPVAAKPRLLIQSRSRPDPHPTSRMEAPALSLAESGSKKDDGSTETVFSKYSNAFIS
jgi:hypothetical protein